jgi:hypothetical protein
VILAGQARIKTGLRFPSQSATPWLLLFALGAGFLKGQTLATSLKSSVYRHFQ